MAGQPTKRGNWGTWAVIDYPNRRIHDEDEIPQCTPKGRAQPSSPKKKVANHKPLKKKKPKVIRLSRNCVYRVNDICAFCIERCLNCDTCARYRGHNESNTRCKFNFGIEHNKCAIKHCMCDKSAICCEFIRKPARIMKYDRVVIINKE